VWYISAASYIFGGVFFEIFGTSEPQSWAVISLENPNNNLKSHDNCEDSNNYSGERKISFISEHFKN
jgi:hypothetical protein